MATQFDFASLGNMFGGGGVPTGLDALLTEDQRKLLGRNAALSAAGALLQASGRSAVPISMGQALGSALQAGQQGYQQARAGSLQDLLVGQKLTEAQRAAKAEADFDKLFQAPPAAAAAPMQPLTGESVSIMEPAPAAPAPVNPLANLNPQQMALVRRYASQRGCKVFA